MQLAFSILREKQLNLS